MLTVSLAASFAVTVIGWFVIAPVSFGKHLAKVRRGFLMGPKP